MKSYQATYGNRNDGWTEREDEILATTVLRYVENGNTQTQAFEAVGREIERTGAACGFRWNSQVRKGYEDELKRAKLASRKFTPTEPVIVEVGKEREPDNTIITINPSKKIEALAVAGFTIHVTYKEKDGAFQLDIFNPKK